jgi:hypothetical protein
MIEIIKEKLAEAEKEAADPNTVWLTQDEIFGKFRDKYSYCPSMEQPKKGEAHNA